MSPEQNIYTVLVATSGLTNLVGMRIYPDEGPSNATLPFLVYQRISTEPSVTHDQMDASVASSLDGCRFQITAIAETASAALAVIYQARLALERSAGLSAIWMDERSISRDEEALSHGRAADFLVWKIPA